MSKAQALLRELQGVNLTPISSNVGQLNDVSRLLQTVVNTYYVENKNHNMLTKHASNDAQNDLFGGDSYNQKHQRK